MSTQQTPLALSLDVDGVKAAIGQAPAPVATTVDPELEARAQALADRLIAIDLADVAAQTQAKAAVETMGGDLQREAGRRSEMLRQPITELARHSEDGGPVANALVDLRVQVEDLDPHHYDFSPGWASRIVGYLPGVGTPLKRYFSRYESAQVILDAVIHSLHSGRQQLERDNITLTEDQRFMRELTLKLEHQITLAQTIDAKLQYRLERDLAGDETRAVFVREELLFPLRQRIMDLQQQLAVNQQGVLATGLIISNNKELIRGVQRAVDVTVNALRVAVTVALALAHQKVVLDKIQALNTTTSNLIAGTAAQLRSQGAAIHAQAAGTGLDIETLKRAFTDISAAMAEISRYRNEALPKMAQTIVEFDRLAAEGESAIQRMEKGERARPVLRLDPE